MSRNKITTTIETITPKWAQEQLDRLDHAQAMGSFKQRNRNERAARGIAQDILHGKFLLTHQGIAFDEDENLLDGQTRLRGVIIANMPVQMLVTRGLPKEVSGGIQTMDVIDAGRPRAVWQALRISHDYPGTALEMSSGARNVVRFVLGNPGLPSGPIGMPVLSTSQILYILEKLNYRTAFERLAIIVPNKTLRPASLAALWGWLWNVDRDSAEKFATAYIKLSNLGEGHPALQLYKYISTKNLRKRMREQAMMGIVANALSVFMSKKRIDNLRPSEDALAWLMDLNWKHVDLITDLTTGQKASKLQAAEAA
jgi:hypothetical protein